MIFLLLVRLARHRVLVGVDRRRPVIDQVVIGAHRQCTEDYLVLVLVLILVQQGTTQHRRVVLRHPGKHGLQPRRDRCELLTFGMLQYVAHGRQLREPRPFDGGFRLEARYARSGQHR